MTRPIALKAYLNSADWVVYLEREHEFILFDAFWKMYGRRLKQETGFGQKHFLTYFKKGCGVWYRSKKELEQADEYFAGLIKKKDKRIGQWLVLEEEVKKKLDNNSKNIRKLGAKEAVKLFYDVLFYNTVIPFRLLSALSIAKGDALKEKLDKIRANSVYFKAMEQLIKPLLIKAAKKLKINYALASLLLVDELVEVLDKGKQVSKEELMKRDEGCYFYSPNYQDYVFFFSDTDILTNVDGDIRTFSGKTAFSGKVNGIVRIVNTPEQISKVKKGDILVSINTNPALMPAISKCAAIVTNEGGLTCHAAIISRELKKPCIIATKVATKVLKDGDYVEVDADTGVITVIERSS